MGFSGLFTTISPTPLPNFPLAARQAFAAALKDHSDAELLKRLRGQRGGRGRGVTQTALAACRALFAG